MMWNTPVITESQLLAAARNWIADCEWADDVDAETLTDKQVIAGIQRHYNGGWAQFTLDA